MALRFLTALIFCLLSSHTFSQPDFGIRKQKLKPVKFDTTEAGIFIYEVKNAVIYFKQDDINEFISSPENNNGMYNKAYVALKELLAQQRPKVRLADLYFSYDQAFRDSIFKQRPQEFLTRQLNEEFHPVGAALLLYGQFMIFSKIDRKILTKNLVARRTNGYFGARYLQFYLPGRQTFYTIVTALGE
jgi:hypothetical protein